MVAWDGPGRTGSEETRWSQSLLSHHPQLIGALQISDIQKERLHFIHKRVAILRVPRIDINQGDSQEVLLRSLSDSGPSPHAPKSSEPPESRKRRHRDAAIFTVNEMEARYLVSVCKHETLDWKLTSCCSIHKANVSPNLSRLRAPQCHHCP